MKNPEIVIRRLNDDRAFACYYKGDYKNQSGKTHKLWTFSLLVTSNSTSDLYNALMHLITAHDRHDERYNKNSEFILQQFHFYKVYNDGGDCIDKRIQFTISPIELPLDFDNTASEDDIITKNDIKAINGFITDIRYEMYDDDHYNDLIHMMINDTNYTSNMRILTAYSLSEDRLKDNDYMNAMMRCLNGTMISKYHYKSHSNETQMWCKNCNHMYNALMNHYYYMGNRVIHNTLTTPKNTKDERKVLNITKIGSHECVKGVIGREVDFLINYDDERKDKEDNTNTDNFDFHDRYLLVPSTIYDMDIINESDMKLRYIRCYNCGTLIKELLV